ncbi:BamA/TamA family outer membrane protein [Caldichromatium japonicum]|uniref:BamA/TamA family outer membrane protein n=2 Tax=Caldichromatium japonicum TaxID=2699430 RepID=A0A6G7VGT5_9GAMM|nr:BamA/TamA family outer membrane protein [Caldichromatium japonicum]
MVLSLSVLVMLACPAAKPFAAERPKIGLALSGGGARGAAHIGVLKVLEALQIPIDYIAGTSMGAIVGGLYAIGLSPAEIEQIVAEIDWTEIFNDQADRPSQRMRHKFEDRNTLIQTRPGVQEDKRKVNLTPALIQGQKLDLALRRYTLPARRIQNFDQLRIPYRAVATDVVTGEAVILDKGDLATAIRASMAVPAVFAPVEIGDRLLVDGGLAMNLPVSIVRTMGAEIIIAVDVSGPRREREEITDVFSMLDQIASLITWRNTQEQIETLSPRDILITPALGSEVLANEFTKMPRAISLGEQAARALHPRLATLALPPDRYAAYRAQNPQAAYQEQPIIRAIRIDNRSRLSERLISERIWTKPGERLDPAAIERQIAQIYDLDDFESVRYYLENQSDGEATLVIVAHEKSWGTSSLQAGLEFSSTTAGDSRFNIGLAYTRLPLNAFNGEWRIQTQLGEEPALYTSLYQPLDPLERWYLGLGVGYLNENLMLFEPNVHNRPIAEYQLARTGGELELGRNLGNWGRLGVRYGRFWGQAEQRIGDVHYPDYEFDLGELGLRFTLDTLDNLSLPRQGWLIETRLLGSRTELGASADYDQFSLDLLHAQTLGPDSLLLGLGFAGDLGGETPPQSYQRLGGFLNLSGFNQNELLGIYRGLARAIYLHDLKTPLLKTYAGASLEVGNVWAERSQIGWEGLRLAGSLFLGADTPIGPLYLGYGQADGGYGALYLLLGRPWGGLREGIGTTYY